MTTDANAAITDLQAAARTLALRLPTMLTLPRQRLLKEAIQRNAALRIEMVQRPGEPWIATIKVATAAGTTTLAELRGGTLQEESE